MNALARKLAAASLGLIPAIAVAGGCPPNSAAFSEETNAGKTVVHCRCATGYTNRGGTCQPISTQSVRQAPSDVERWRSLAKDEWYWFKYHQFSVMTAAFWASVSGDPMGPPVDDDAREAQEHLKKYLEYARNIEASTHSLQTAQRRYEERVQNYRIARNGSYSVIESYGTAKNDASPPTDFDPWSHDEDAREGKRCVFEANGELLCR